jgi:hypothetical protein
MLLTENGYPPGRNRASTRFLTPGVLTVKKISNTPAFKRVLMTLKVVIQAF